MSVRPPQAAPDRYGRDEGAEGPRFGRAPLPHSGPGAGWGGGPDGGLGVGGDVVGQRPTGSTAVLGSGAECVPWCWALGLNTQWCWALGLSARSGAGVE